MGCNKFCLKMKLFLLLYTICLMSMCNGKLAINTTLNGKYPQLITAALMKNYDRINRPVSNLSDAVRIRVQPSLISIINVDIAKQLILFKQWLNMYWNDPNLAWDPADYGGVNTVMLQRSKIWLPDVVIVGQTSVSALSDKLSIAFVTSDGNVSISSDQVVTNACQFNVVDFPFDTQNCSIHYSSWMYTATQIIPVAAEPADLTQFNENDEWTLASYTTRTLTSVDLGDDGNEYVDVYFDIKITRKPNYYILTFIWPSFLITCLSIIGIFSPFNEAGEREEKVTMGLTTLLTMAVILMIITGDMPKSSNGIPLLGLFIMLEIGISSIASVSSVFIIYLHSNWMNGTPVPRWLLKLTFLTKKNRKILKFDENGCNGSGNTQAWQYKEDEADSKKVPELLVSIKRSVDTLNLFINISEMHHKSETLREKWSKVACRLDLMLMMFFLFVNAIICVTVIEIGNSKLGSS